MFVGEDRDVAMTTLCISEVQVRHHHLLYLHYYTKFYTVIYCVLCLYGLYTLTAITHLVT